MIASDGIVITYPKEGLRIKKLESGLFSVQKLKPVPIPNGTGHIETWCTVYSCSDLDGAMETMKSTIQGNGIGTVNECLEKAWKEAAKRVAAGWDKQ